MPGPSETSSKTNSDNDPVSRKDSDRSSQSRPKGNAPKSRLPNLLVLLSFGFSISVIVWAVWVAYVAVTPPNITPLEPYTPTSVGSLSSDPAVFGSKANLNSQDYVRYARELDDKVLKMAREKSPQAWPKEKVDKKAMRKQWEQRRDKLRDHVQTIYAETGEDGFKEGTAESGYLEQLEKVYQDVPPSN